MLPDLRFAVSAVLASMLLLVTAFGLAATVRVAHQRAAGAGDGLRTLAYADPIEWGRFFVEQQPIGAIRADAPAVDRTVPEHAPVVMPDANAAAAVMPDGADAPVVPDTHVAAAVAPDTMAAASAVSDASKAAVIAPPPQATAVVVPDIDVTGAVGADVGVSKKLDVGKAVEEVKAVDPAEPVAVFEPLPETTGLITPSFRSPSDAESPSAGFEGALEPSERVVALPAFPNAGPGFVPPHDIALPVPRPESKPATKPKKKAAKRRVLARPGVEPPLATTGYPVPAYDNKWPLD